MIVNFPDGTVKFCDTTFSISARAKVRFSVFLFVQIARDLGIVEQAFDPVSFLEAFVGAELQLGRELEPQPLGNLALEEGGVGTQRLENRCLVFAQQRLQERWRS